jgi:hypothetical protein
MSDRVGWLACDVTVNRVVAPAECNISHFIPRTSKPSDSRRYIWILSKPGTASLYSCLLYSNRHSDRRYLKILFSRAADRGGAYAPCRRSMFGVPGARSRGYWHRMARYLVLSALGQTTAAIVWLTFQLRVTSTSLQPI